MFGIFKKKEKEEQPKKFYTDTERKSALYDYYNKMYKQYTTHIFKSEFKCSLKVYIQELDKLVLIYIDNEGFVTELEYESELIKE